MQDLFWQLRDFLIDLVPDTNELIWDNYNALALAYSKSGKLKDAFCHIALYSQHVNFGFNRGAELSQDRVTLNGKGKLIRHITIKAMDDFPKEEVADLVRTAVQRAEILNPSLATLNENPRSLVMSVSEKKIRPK